MTPAVAIARETAAEALANLVSQPRRSGLALLGIVIGAAAIIAMVNVGHMAQLESMKLFGRMGVDMLLFQASPTGEATAGLPRPVVEALPREQPGVTAAIPIAVGRGTVHAGPARAEVGIVGMSPALVPLARLPVSAGRTFGAADGCAQVAILGAGAAAKLSRPGAAAAPGSRIDIGDYGFTVVGLFAPVIAESLNPTDYNDAVFLPLDCIRRVLPGPDPTVALVRIAAGADGARLGDAIRTRLERPGSAVQVLSARDMIRTMNAQKAVHTRVLAASGVIALVVGGIGVMNVMLMNMVERRREIGLRVAIGASPRIVQLMFVIEAAVLTTAGGAIGVAVGLGGAWAVARGSGWDFAVAGWTVAAGPALAAFMGLLFGAYPAVSASRLDPIDALRGE